jgi:hypothetical protein
VCSNANLEKENSQQITCSKGDTHISINMASPHLYCRPGSSRAIINSCRPPSSPPGALNQQPGQPGLFLLVERDARIHRLFRRRLKEKRKNILVS